MTAAHARRAAQSGRGRRKADDRVKRLELPALALEVLLTAGHITAYTLLGMVVHDDLANTETTASAPDTALGQPDSPPASGA